MFSTMKHVRAAGCTLVVLVVAMLASEAQAGQTIKLGGSVDGWTNKGSIDYNKWLSDYKVKVGDTVEFNNNDDSDHTVVEVNKEGYDSCGKSGKTLSTDTVSPGYLLSVDFLEAGDLYYICGLPAHCIQGQKVHIEVFNADGTANTTPSETPGKSGAPELPGFSWTSLRMVLAVATFSLMVAAATM